MPGGGGGVRGSVAVGGQGRGFHTYGGMPGNVEAVEEALRIGCAVKRVDRTTAKIEGGAGGGVEVDRKDAPWSWRTERGETWEGWAGKGRGVERPRREGGLGEREKGGEQGVGDAGFGTNDGSKNKEKDRGQGYGGRLSVDDGAMVETNTADKST